MAMSLVNWESNPAFKKPEFNDSSTIWFQFSEENVFVYVLKDFHRKRQELPVGWTERRRWRPADLAGNSNALDVLLLNA